MLLYASAELKTGQAVPRYNRSTLIQRSCANHSRVGLLLQKVGDTQSPTVVGLLSCKLPSEVK